MASLATGGNSSHPTARSRWRGWTWPSSASTASWRVSPDSSETSLRAPDVSLLGERRGYRARMSTSTAGVGPLLREGRGRRRRSQMDLAFEAGVSPKHLSFVETGRSRPSPELLLTLARHLDVPLRERNSLLLAAGYAPRYHE